MLSLFTENNSYTKKISMTPNPTIERIIKSQFDKYKKYMLDSSFYVDNRNPFVQILNNGIPSASDDMSELEIIMQIKNNVEYLANVVGCTSNRNKGKYFKHEDLTYILLLDNDIDILDKKVLPVISTIYTDYCTLDFSTAPDKEMLILKLNPIALIIDYLRWEKKRNTLELATSYNIYVATVLLPSVWDTKINHVIYNRMVNLYYGIPMVRFRNKLPIEIINIENILDNDLKRIIKFFNKNKKVHISTFLTSFNYNGTVIKDTLSFKGMTFTSNTLWIVWLSRIKVIDFLIDIAYDTDSVNINNDVIKDLFIDIKRYLNRNTIMMKLEKTYQQDFEDTLEYIKKKINYNA